MTGLEFRNYVVETFKRTDKDTEIYKATTDVIQMLANSYPNDDFKQIKTDQTITAGANSFSVPSDFLRFLNDINCLDSNSGWSLRHLSPDEFERNYQSLNADTSEDGAPRDYCYIGGTVYVGPRPDKTYTFRYIYEFSQSSDIVAGTTTVPFTQINRKMLKHYVLGALYQDLEQADLAQYHNQIGSALFEDIVDIDEDNKRGVTIIQYRD